MTTQREFPNWEQLYQDQNVESMPWFHPDIDPDLDAALTKLNLNAGTVLDLGTGPGTQAMALARRGFQVTATDLSDAAIFKARSLAEAEGLDISWQQDDILNSKLDRTFDLVFDRGCFHVFAPDLRATYVKVVDNLIKSKGYLFLKCFSYLESGEKGPYRFTPKEIQDIFQERFNILSIEETVYQGQLNSFPKALFSILQKP